MKKSTNSKVIVENTSAKGFAFERINYIWMLIGLALLALGYILLIGGGAKSPDEFNYSLFNAQRLVVAPILMVLGLGVEVYAILLKPKQKNNEVK
ncbi:MAG: DUF3098 domain-containing protein [Bacteroidales bacterium]|nr:DUF3098 domain-containing protein [Bacteroidales bacterium]